MQQESPALTFSTGDLNLSRKNSLLTPSEPQSATTRRKRPCKVVCTSQVSPLAPKITQSKSFRLDNECLLLFDKAQQDSFMAGLSQINLLKEVSSLKYSSSKRVHTLNFVQNNSSDIYKIHYQSLIKKLVSLGKGALQNKLESVRKYSNTDFMMKRGIPRFLKELWGIKGKDIEGGNWLESLGLNDQPMVLQQYIINGKNKIVLQNYVMNQKMIEQLGFKNQGFEDYVNVTKQVPPVNKPVNQEAYYDFFEAEIDSKLQCECQQIQSLLFTNGKQLLSCGDIDEKLVAKNHLVQSFKFQDSEGQCRLVTAHVFADIFLKDTDQIVEIAKINKKEVQLPQQHIYQQQQLQLNSYHDSNKKFDSFNNTQQNNNIKEFLQQCQEYYADLKRKNKRYFKEFTAFGEYPVNYQNSPKKVQTEEESHSNNSTAISNPLDLETPKKAKFSFDSTSNMSTEKKRKFSDKFLEKQQQKQQKELFDQQEIMQLVNKQLSNNDGGQQCQQSYQQVQQNGLEQYCFQMFQEQQKMALGGLQSQLWNQNVNKFQGNLGCFTSFKQ